MGAKSKYLLKPETFIRLRAPTEREKIKFKEKCKMQKKIFKKLLSFGLCLVLIAAVALVGVGCSDNNSGQASSTPQNTVTFEFSVIDSKGEQTDFTIETEEETVGDALLEEGLIAGDDGQYGLYVKTVNGETLDYNTDGMYWSFYIDGEYAMTGVDATEIEEGKVYSFKAEKS